MTTKMDASRLEGEGERRRDVAAALHFLVLAQREFRHHSIASIAAANEISRSNLSAYLASRGERRSVADVKARRILLAMGANWQLGLRPCLHRWDVALARDALDGLEAVARSNPAIRARLVGTVPWSVGDVFGIFEAAGDALVFARIPCSLATEVAGWFGVGATPTTDAETADFAAAAWEVEDPAACTAAVRKLLLAPVTATSRRTAAMAIGG